MHSGASVNSESQQKEISWLAALEGEKNTQHFKDKGYIAVFVN
jgi:hypothetical protein